MQRTILVAVDGSETSRHALKYATDLARTMSAALRIIHVVDMGWLPIAPEIAIDSDRICAARRGAGESILAAAGESALHAGIEAKTALVETDSPTQHVAEVIAGEALRWPVELVVLGTHGHRGFQHLTLGSVAERVARLALRPVLLVPLPRTVPSA
jgi:nucleotide-binding universal stress UspA family protein